MCNGQRATGFSTWEQANSEFGIRNCQRRSANAYEHRSAMHASNRAQRVVSYANGRAAMNECPVGIQNCEVTEPQ